MKVSDVVRKVNSLGFSIQKFYVSGDTALLFYNIKKDVEEIEVCISEELYYKLEEEDRIDFNSKNRKGYYSLLDTPDIKLIRRKKHEFNCYKYGDLYVEDIRGIKCVKKESEKIKKFLERHPNYPEY